MTIASAITAAQGRVAAAYTAIENKGGTLPATQNTANLPTAIATIPTGGGGDTVTATNNTGSAISDGDKVWINKSGNDYSLIPYSSNVDNFEVNGSVNINYETGVVNNFSSNNYLMVNDTFSPLGDSWEITAKVKTGNDLDSEQSAFDFLGTSSGFRIGLVNPGIATRKWQFLVMRNGNFINTSNHYGTFTVQANTVYWLKAGYDGTKYYLKYSLDGISYVNDVSYTSNQLIGEDCNVSVGNAPVWDGEVDLSQSYINIAGERWWTPFTQESNITENTMTGTASEGIAVSGTGDVYIGNVIEPTISSLSITPSTSAQTFNSSSVDGYKPVTVSAVTSAIDANITAGNIKNGVSILGVTGNYTGTTPTGTLLITTNGIHNVTNYASANVNVSSSLPTGIAVYTLNGPFIIESDDDPQGNWGNWARNISKIVMTVADDFLVTGAALYDSNNDIIYEGYDSNDFYVNEVLSFYTSASSWNVVLGYWDSDNDTVGNINIEPGPMVVGA